MYILYTGSWRIYICRSGALDDLTEDELSLLPNPPEVGDVKLNKYNFVDIQSITISARSDSCIKIYVWTPADYIWTENLRNIDITSESVIIYFQHKVKNQHTSNNAPNSG